MKKEIAKTKLEAERQAKIASDYKAWIDAMEEEKRKAIVPTEVRYDKGGIYDDRPGKITETDALSFSSAKSSSISTKCSRSRNDKVSDPVAYDDPEL